MLSCPPKSKTLAMGLIYNFLIVKTKKSFGRYTRLHCNGTKHASFILMIVTNAFYDPYEWVLNIECSIKLLQSKCNLI